MELEVIEFKQYIVIRLYFSCQFRAWGEERTASVSVTHLSSNARVTHINSQVRTLSGSLGGVRLVVVLGARQRAGRLECRRPRMLPQSSSCRAHLHSSRAMWLGSMALLESLSPVRGDKSNCARYASTALRS